MMNKIIEGNLESMSFIISKIKEDENDIEKINGYLDSIQKRVEYIREELETIK